MDSFIESEKDRQGKKMRELEKMGDNLTDRSKDRPECERLSAKDQARECVSEEKCKADY